jgi:hypothetical protein
VPPAELGAAARKGSGGRGPASDVMWPSAPAGRGRQATMPAWMTGESLQLHPHSSLALRVLPAITISLLLGPLLILLVCYL